VSGALRRSWSRLDVWRPMQCRSAADLQTPVVRALAPPLTCGGACSALGARTCRPRLVHGGVREGVEESPPATRPTRSASPTGCNTSTGVAAVFDRTARTPALRAVRPVCAGQSLNRTAGQPGHTLPGVFRGIATTPRCTRAAARPASRSTTHR
jgi:hypothetical protein